MDHTRMHEQLCKSSFFSGVSPQSSALSIHKSAAILSPGRFRNSQSTKPIRENYAFQPLTDHLWRQMMRNVKFLAFPPGRCEHHDRGGG
jgi:hypothetical protein